MRDFDLDAQVLQVLKRCDVLHRRAIRSDVVLWYGPSEPLTPIPLNADVAPLRLILSVGLRDCDRKFY